MKLKNVKCAITFNKAKFKNNSKYFTLSISRGAKPPDEIFRNLTGK